MTVKAVALNRLAASLPNGVFERCHALLLRSRCPCHVEDFFFQNCAVQIIDTVAEGNLRKRQTEADPVGREVIDVIKINATNREIAKLLKRGGAFYVGEDPVGLGRFESERNKPGKPTGLILQLAELAQMIDAMSRRFDVPVEHGASAAAAHFVPSAMNVEPFSSGFFPATNRVTNLRIENLRATAGY